MDMGSRGWWHGMREGWALFVSSCAAALTPALVMQLYLCWGSSDAIAALWLDQPFLIALIGYVHAMLLGLPLALVLRHKGWFRAWPMALAGALVGALPVGLLLVQANDPGFFARMVGLGAGLGLSGGLGFYAAYRVISPSD